LERAILKGSIFMNEKDKEYEEYYVENLSIDMSTLQAIIQQCKELGWIE